MSQAPTLANSTFTVLAAFSKPITPFQPSAVSVTGAAVTSLTFSDKGTACLLVLEGTPGVTASLQLTTGNFQDVAMNPGKPATT